MIFCTRLIKLRNLHQPENLETVLNEAAEATYRNRRVFGVFGHLKNDDQRLVVLSIDSHVVRYPFTLLMGSIVEPETLPVPEPEAAILARNGTRALKRLAPVVVVPAPIFFLFLPYPDPKQLIKDPDPHNCP